MSRPCVITPARAFASILAMVPSPTSTPGMIPRPSFPPSLGSALVGSITWADGTQTDLSAGGIDLHHLYPDQEGDYTITITRHMSSGCHDDSWGDSVIIPRDLFSMNSEEGDDG